MSVIKVRCLDQVLKITEAPVVASGGKNEVKVEFDFCEKWDGYTKTAVFYRDINDPYYAILNNKDTCVVPWEVCYEEGSFYFNVFGNKGETVRTSTTVKYKVKKGVTLEALKPSDPTPDVYDQIMATMADMAEMGNDAEIGRMIQYYHDDSGNYTYNRYTYLCAEKFLHHSSGSTDSYKLDLVENEVYRVCVNDSKSYFCTAHQLPDGSGLYLGNPNWVDGIEADANYPFGIVVKPTTVATVAYIAQPYDVEVFKAVSNIDATLKKEKLAADAKATGAAIADAETRVAEAIETAKKEVGVLRINQSGSLDENSVEDIFQHEGPAYMNLLNSDRYASTVDVSRYDPYLLEYVKATNSLVDHNVILDPETNRRKVERTVIKLFELASGLTEEGKAADAKVVGEAIAQAKNEAGTALNTKVDKSGWSAGKFLGTDASGNVVAVDAPKSNEAVSDEHIEEVIAEYLAENPVGSNVELDTTLSEEGKAADAKAVGDAVREVSDSLTNLFDKRDIIPEQTVEVNVYNNYPDYGYVWNREGIDCAAQIVPGETYYVVFNGEQYTCVAKEYAEMFPMSLVYVGNFHAWQPGAEDTGEPFMIGSMNSSAATLYTNVEGVPTGFSGKYTHDVRVYQMDRSKAAISTDTTLTKVGQAADAKAVGDKLTKISGGISVTAKNLLITILRNALFTSDQSANITALEAALAVSGGSGGSGDNGDTEAVTIVQTGNVLAISGVANVQTITKTGTVLALA